MLRRVCPVAANRLVSGRASALVSRRNAFFMPEPAGEGIWRRTLEEVHVLLRLMFFATSYYMFIHIEKRYGTEDQFIGHATDLWEDDGTELEGEEAVAYHRIWKERIMPYMDDLQAKIDAAA